MHQPENEQHDHQRVQHAPLLLPDPVMPVGDTHERLDDAAPEPDKRILWSQDRCRQPAGTASGSTGAGQQHLLASFSSADTGKRPSESCLPPTHSPCVPSSGRCTASWPHGSRSPGTSPDPQRSPPVPSPGRAAPFSPPAAAEPCRLHTSLA